MAERRHSDHVQLAPHEKQARANFQRRVPDGSTAEAVYGAVAESIENGWLAPGSHLGEEYLAAIFSVSRTPIREALMRLEAEHLAERDRHRGLVVGRITSTQIVEIYVVREALDGAAARLAATQAQALDLNRLDQINNRMREAAVAERYADMAAMNLDFHAVLTAASRNEMLQRFGEQVHRWVRRFASTTFSYPGRALEAVDEHARLVAALRARNPDEAERIARDHMRRAMEIRIELESYPAPSHDGAQP